MRRFLGFNAALKLNLSRIDISRNVSADVSCILKVPKQMANNFRNYLDRSPDRCYYTSVAVVFHWWNSSGRPCRWVKRYCSA